ADGTWYGHIGSCLDITERRRAEASLRISEERSRSLSACSPVGIFTSDDEGRIDYINPMTQEITGVPSSLAVGNWWATVIHPDHYDRATARWRAAVASGCPMDIVTRVLSCERGTTRWVRIRTAPLRLDEGTIVGHVGTVEDI